MVKKETVVYMAIKANEVMKVYCLLMVKMVFLANLVLWAPVVFLVYRDAMVARVNSVTMDVLVKKVFQALPAYMVVKVAEVNQVIQQALMVLYLDHAVIPVYPDNVVLSVGLVLPVPQAIQVQLDLPDQMVWLDYEVILDFPVSPVNQALVSKVDVVNLVIMLLH